VTVFMIVLLALGDGLAFLAADALADDAHALAL
jgi:hypothetical protein